MAQVNTTVGDLAGNLEKITAYAKMAEKQGADLVTFPELALCGYPPEDLLLKRSFYRDTLDVLKELSKKKIKPVMVVGYPHYDKYGTNSAAVIYKNELLASVDKFMLPNYGVFDEKRYFKPGVESYVFDTGRIRFGVNVCEDIWISPGITEVLVRAGADLIVNVSSSPYHVRKEKYREKMVATMARRNKVYFAYCNLVGGQDELVFDGNSMVFDPAGKLIASGKHFMEDLVIVDISPEKIPDNKKSLNSIKKAPPVHIIKPEGFRVRKKKKIVVPMVYPPLKREEATYKALVLGTSDYIEKNGFSDVVIALSGGIDSALTAAIAYDCVGADKLHLVFMPSRFTSKSSHRDAKKLAKNLGAELLVFEIDDAFEQYKELLAEQFHGMPEDIAEENLQARIRGNLIMALSNKFGWLVLTTGNKSEISVGYCTLYGDTAGGFAVLKDVYKTLVFKLARYFNRKEGRTVIPRSTITKPPSAELRADQKDTDSLPEYELLDPILKLYIEKDLGQSEIIECGFDAELVKRILRLVDLAEYKRRQSPPGVKITPKAFGRDRRMPITQKFLA